MQTLTRERFESGLTYAEYCQSVEKHQGLWNGVYEQTTIPEDAASRLHELPGRRLVAVLAEDWCGDAASLVPILAKLADSAPEMVELRVLERDENHDIMDRYLSHGGRSIPIAIVMDEQLNLLGWWGPRPAPAQAIFRQKIREFRAGRLKDKKEEVNKPVLRWYRKDRGRHTIDEFLMVLERGGELRA